jgi:hypothetical protein
VRCGGSGAVGGAVRLAGRPTTCVSGFTLIR